MTGPVPGRDRHPGSAPVPGATPSGDRPGARRARDDRSSERVFLEGPQSRSRDLWIALRTLRDLIRGFRVLHFVGPCVTVFGSARFAEDHPHYAVARRVGQELARLGFTVMTGGGPGIMEAANRGAKEAGGVSVACNIELPHEQEPNAYLDRYVTLRYFFTRKVMLFKYSYAFVVLPGGVGTMDELFEALTLIQTGKIQNFPVVLMCTSYWLPLLDQLQTMVEEGTIAKADLDLLFVTDEVSAAMAHIQRFAIDQFGLTRRRMPRRSRLLGEQEAPRPAR